MHPLKNGSQATLRPANKPLVGTAGWFTESGENNVPSYPGADWFNHNIAEFQAALAEMDVAFDPQNDDHLAKAFRGINQRLGAKVIGVINVSEIINNSPEFILPITPELGPYVTLAGHGAANFTITGFGDACPVGYVFSLLIPRTIANTGGATNSLGNYVQFNHTLAGDGIDLRINTRQVGVSTLYTYQAYPDATDAFGNISALSEQLTFVHIGAGRWRCVKLPDDFYAQNANGNYHIKPNGVCSIVQDIPTSVTSGGSASGTASFPRILFDLPITTSASAWLGGGSEAARFTSSLSNRSLTSISWAVRDNGSGGVPNVRIFANSVATWKPNI